VVEKRAEQQIQNPFKSHFSRKKKAASRFYNHRSNEMRNNGGRQFFGNSSRLGLIFLSKNVKKRAKMNNDQEKEGTFLTIIR